MANVNIRVDDAIKAQADALFTELGMNTTTAVNIFLRKAVQYGGIPFNITTERLEQSEVTEDDLIALSAKHILKERKKVFEELAK